MTNIVNLSAEIGANFIGDDAQPSLSITNTSTGPGLLVDRLQIISGASLINMTVDKMVLTSAATISGNASGVAALSINKTVLSGPTIELSAATPDAFPEIVAADVN